MAKAGMREFSKFGTEFYWSFFRPKKMAEKALWGFWAKVLWGFWAKVLWGFRSTWPPVKLTEAAIA